MTAAQSKAFYVDADPHCCSAHPTILCRWVSFKAAKIVE